MPPENRRRKSTLRWEVPSDEDETDDEEEDQVEIVGPTQEEINAMIERRKERRRSSIYHGEGSILFAASKVIKILKTKRNHTFRNNHDSSKVVSTVQCCRKSDKSQAPICKL